MPQENPLTAAIYVEPNPKTEFRVQRGADGQEAKVPGRNLGRFGFVTTGQKLLLTQEEYAAVANDPRFLSPEDYARRQSEKKGSEKPATPPSTPAPGGEK